MYLCLLCVCASRRMALQQSEAILPRLSFWARLWKRSQGPRLGPFSSFCSSFSPLLFSTRVILLEPIRARLDWPVGGRPGGAEFSARARASFHLFSILLLLRALRLPLLAASFPRRHCQGSVPTGLLALSPPLPWFEFKQTWRMILQRKPTESFVRKLGLAGELTDGAFQFIGRHLLEALRFLHMVGVPYGVLFAPSADSCYCAMVGMGSVQGSCIRVTWSSPKKDADCSMSRADSSASLPSIVKPSCEVEPLRCAHSFE